MLDFSEIQIGKKYDRPWLATEWGFRGYEAISRGVFCPRGGGQIILFVTRIKQESLEQEATSGSQTQRSPVKRYISSIVRFIIRLLNTKASLV